MNDRRTDGGGWRTPPPPNNSRTAQDPSVGRYFVCYGVLLETMDSIATILCIVQIVRFKCILS